MPTPNAPNRSRNEAEERNFLPYLVVGYVGSLRDLDMLRPQTKPRPPPPHLRLQVPQPAPPRNHYSGELPWSYKELNVYVTHPPDMSQHVELELPKYSKIIGYASSVDCFNDDDVNFILFEKAVLTAGGPGRVRGVKGIIFPKVNDQKVYPQDGRIICRKLQIDGMDRPDEVQASTGIRVADGCEVKYKYQISSRGPFYHVKPENDKTLVLIVDALIECKVENQHLCDPVFMEKMPNVSHAGEDVYIWCLWWVMLVVALVLFLVPGILQYFLSDGNRVGDVLNQIIGSGSVLVGLILFLFQQFFDEDVFRRSTIAGSCNVKNDFTVRLLARERVRLLEKFACDPRMPAYLIARYKNSAVRSSRGGWLRIGCRISAKVMPKHGYYLLENRGLVLDVIDGRFLKCARIGKNVTILRKDEEDFEGVICKQFNGNDVFV